MEFARKDLGYYTDIITTPFLISVGWSLVGFLLALINPTLVVSRPMPWIGLLVLVAIFSYVGWSAVRHHAATTPQGAWAGALCGLAAGFAGAIIGVITVMLVPGITEQAVNLALTQAQAKLAASGNPGASINREFIEKIIMISTYASLIISPLFQGIVGAAIAAVASALARRTGQPTQHQASA